MGNEADFPSSTCLSSSRRKKSFSQDDHVMSVECKKGGKEMKLLQEGRERRRGYNDVWRWSPLHKYDLLISDIYAIKIFLDRKEENLFSWRWKMRQNVPLRLEFWQMQMRCVSEWVNACSSSKFFHSQERKAWRLSVTLPNKLCTQSQRGEKWHFVLIYLSYAIMETLNVNVV